MIKKKVIAVFASVVLLSTFSFNGVVVGVNPQNNTETPENNDQSQGGVVPGEVRTRNFDVLTYLLEEGGWPPAAIRDLRASAAAAVDPALPVKPFMSEDFVAFAFSFVLTRLGVSGGDLESIAVTLRDRRERRGDPLPPDQGSDGSNRPDRAELHAAITDSLQANLDEIAVLARAAGCYDDEIRLFLDLAIATGTDAREPLPSDRFLGVLCGLLRRSGIPHEEVPALWRLLRNRHPNPRVFQQGQNLNEAWAVGLATLLAAGL
jgi:hypothetical protein